MNKKQNRDQDNPDQHIPHDVFVDINGYFHTSQRGNDLLEIRRVQKCERNDNRHRGQIH